MALITVSLGKTVNMGNYESLRVDMSIQEVCPYSKRRSDFVKEQHQILNKEIQKMIDREVAATRR